MKGKKIPVKSKKKKSVKKALKVIDGSVQVAIDVLLSGKKSSEATKAVEVYRKANGLSLNENTIAGIVSKANCQLSEEFGKDKEHVMSLHVERYNRDIKSILALENPFEKIKEEEKKIEEQQGAMWKEIDTKGMSPDEVRQLVINSLINEEEQEEPKEDLGKLKFKLINSYYQALSTMLAKEKVLQMHSKGFQILIHNKLNVEVNEPKKKDYDLSKYSMAEKIDFLNLLLKAKLTDSETSSVILRTDKEQEKTIDIEHEVVEETPNVQLIKHEEQPIAPPVQNGTAMLDLNAKLAATLKKKALEAFTNAGSKTAEKE